MLADTSTAGAVPAAPDVSSMLGAANRGAEDARSWQVELAQAYTSTADLQAAGLLTAAEAERWSQLPFQIRLPRYYASLIDRSNLSRCPIALQALPHAGELDPVLPAWAEALSQRAWGLPAPWRTDPTGDTARLGAPRLTHRYRDRAILHLSPACAMYCRFCFRKQHLSQHERSLYGGSLAPALAYLAAHPEIHEVILTGGDPLALSDALLSRVLDQLDALPHLRRVRLHSRMPVTLPHRLTPALLALLGAKRRLHISLMAHFNHPRELTERARQALDACRRAGLTLLNQSVLLRGVHDALETLVDLPGGLGKTSLTDGGVRCLVSRADAQLGGALYALPPPHTRMDTTPKPVLYADLWAHSSAPQQVTT